MTERGGWYETHAAEAAARYESVAAEQINAWLLDLLPTRRSVVLDVGAGSGRDTAWLTSLGHEVIATDPSAAMRAQARKWHPDLGVQYLPDRLPELTKTFRTGISFDFILVNAMWMHVAPADRKRAFRKLVTLLKPGGVIAFTLREPVDAARDMHPVSGAEIEELARQHGAFVERRSDGADLLGRTPLRWEQVAVRVPDDGTGALPLLRHIILNDDKSSTYKLALLRVLCRIADGAAGWAADESSGDSDRVDLPLGLVALYWIRLFKPLLADGRNLPQMRGNVGLNGLSFVRKGGFSLLLDMPDIELRAGMQIADNRRIALHRALRDARNTIANMPAKFLTLHDGNPVFPVETRQPGRAAVGGRLDAPYLWSFGSVSVPRHLWRAFQRYNVWIEPAIIEEWVRLMKQYAGNQVRELREADVVQGMTWSEPNRAVTMSRERAERLKERGSLHCVWSGRKLGSRFNIDHCFPWASWPCSDLWNLLPASPRVNREKHDKLPADLVLRRAKDRIVDWWDIGYVRADNRILTERFALEASATLPTLDLPTGKLDGVLGEARLHRLLEDVFSAVSLQRLRLSNDQQIPEWQGPTVRPRP